MLEGIAHDVRNGDASLARRARRVSGRTSTAAGLPWRVMVTSSPALTRSRSWGRAALASLTVRVVDINAHCTVMYHDVQIDATILEDSVNAAAKYASVGLVPKHRIPSPRTGDSGGRRAPDPSLSHRATGRQPDFGGHSVALRPDAVSSGVLSYSTLRAGRRARR